jgi:hypothetical protein
MRSGKLIVSTLAVVSILALPAFAAAGNHAHRSGGSSFSGFSAPARSFTPSAPTRNIFARSAPTFAGAPTYRPPVYRAPVINPMRTSNIFGATNFATTPRFHAAPITAPARFIAPATTLPARSLPRVPFTQPFGTNYTDNDGDEYVPSNGGNNGSNWARYHSEPDADDYAPNYGNSGGYAPSTYDDDDAQNSLCTGDGDADDCGAPGSNGGNYFGQQTYGYPTSGQSLASERAQLLIARMIARANYGAALRSGNRARIAQAHRALMSIDHRLARVNAKMYGTYTPGRRRRSAFGQFIPAAGGYNNGYGYNPAYSNNAGAALSSLMQNFIP